MHTLVSHRWQTEHLCSRLAIMNQKMWVITRRPRQSAHRLPLVRLDVNMQIRQRETEVLDSYLAARCWFDGLARSGIGNDFERRKHPLNEVGKPIGTFNETGEHILSRVKVDEGSLALARHDGYDTATSLCQGERRCRVLFQGSFKLQYGHASFIRRKDRS